MTTCFYNYICFVITFVRRANKIAQRVEVPATGPDDPSSISRTHMVEGENRLLKVVL